MCLFTDAITADVMDAAPGLKVIANVAVGYNNIDVPAARARGHRRHQHAGRADRGDRRPDVGADHGHHAARVAKAIG